jgi:hypothetical protein
MSSKPRPPEIDQAKREAKALTDSWKTAEAAYKADPRAESALNLARNRDTYAFLLADLSTMMGAAKAKASDDKPGPNRVVFRQWDTQFLAQAYVPDEFGGTPAPVTPVTRPGSAAAAPPVDDVSDKARVHCKLQIAITKPEAEADKLFNEAFLQWLNSNRDRAGVPYTIAVDMKKAMTSRRSEKIPEPAANQQQQQRPEPSEFEPPEEPTRPPPARRPGGKPGPGGGQPGEEGQQIGERTPFRPGSPRNSPTQQQAKPGSDDVNKLAPLPNTEPLALPGATVWYYTVEWDAVIRPPSDGQAKEGGQ